MKRLFVSIGIALLIQPQLSMAFDGETLYYSISKIIQQSMELREAELAVEKHLSKLLDEEVLELEPEDIDYALQSRYLKLCGTVEEEVRYKACKDLAKKVKLLVEKNSWIRMLGRDLQIIATGYEMESDGHSARINHISSGLPSIINIWQSGSDEMTNPVRAARIRVEGYKDEEKMNDLVQEVAGALEDLIEEERGKKDYTELAGAIHRYRHGVNSIEKSEGSCQSGGGGAAREDITEDLKILTDRWCDVEKALKKVWDEVPHDRKEYDPPLSFTERAVFKPIPEYVLGILVWVRNDDVGVVWDVPIEPALPLLRDGTLGGVYPSKPPQQPKYSEGICSHPFATRGYMCRPIESEMCPVHDNAEDGELKIQLTDCKPQFLKGTLQKFTESGPNMCGVGGWRQSTEKGDFAGEQSRTRRQPKDTPSKNTDLKKDFCSLCIADLTCSNPEGDSGGQTLSKDEKGRIEVKIDPNTGAFATYTILHEMVHVQQECALQHSGDSEHSREKGQSVDACCASEFQASLVMCNALKEDGVLGALGYSIEMCAGMFSNLSCGNKKDECSGKEAMPMEAKEFLKIVKSYVSEHASSIGLPTSCSQAISNLDGRAVGMKESLPQVCSPLCKTRYENTIGNNLCYTGQCIEQSVEQHRITPGRVPYLVADEAFPWESCVEPDPQKGKFLSVPALSVKPVPPYLGRKLIQKMDMLLCQSNGFPRSAPPIICSFKSKRRTAIPTKHYSALWQSSRAQQEERLQYSDRLQLSMSNIGTRIGTDLFADYMKIANKNLRDLVQSITQILEEIGTTSFPRTACPRHHIEGCDIFEYTGQSASTQ